MKYSQIHKKKVPTTNQEVLSLLHSVPTEMKKHRRTKVKTTLGEVIKASQADCPTFSRRKDFYDDGSSGGEAAQKERRKWWME